MISVSSSVVWGPWYAGNYSIYPWFPVLWIALIGLFFLAFFVFFRMGRRYWCSNGWWGRTWMGNPGSPEEILRVRLARGEITRQEYQELLEEVHKK